MTWIPDHFYITELGLFAYVVAYLPLILLCVKLFRRHLLPRLGNLHRFGIPGWILVVFLALAPLIRVYVFSVEVKNICNVQAGLHVYKVVEADGFDGHVSPKEWLEYGFSFVEHDAGYKGILRYSEVGGEIREDYVKERSAIYSYDIHNLRYQDKVSGIYFDREVVKNRINGDIIGDLTTLVVYPAWPYGALNSIFGIDANPWSCVGKSGKIPLNYIDLIKATLRPSMKNIAGEK